MEGTTDWLTIAQGLWRPEAIVPVTKAAITLVLGLLLSRAAAGLADRATAQHLTPQQRMIARRAVQYGLMGITVATALSEVGLDLTVLLGAAGVLSVAVGFASQTSASNLISGLFLLAEQPFVIGDIISVQGTVGEVVGIDFLSVRLRTFDNVLVRLPNELLLKSPITNLTAYPIRRCDLTLRVAASADLAEVQRLLIEAAARLPICLDEPRPQMFVEAFSELGTQLQFTAWASRENYGELRWKLQREAQLALTRAGLTAPTLVREISPAPTPRG